MNPVERVGRPWISVTALCFVLNMFDGVNIFTLTYVAPALEHRFSIGSEAFSIVFSAGLAGMALGGLLVAPQADRIGRRPVLFVALTLMGAAMVASAYAPSVAWLCLARLFVGVGIGTVLASISALSAGFAPERYRNTAVGLPQAGYPIGATVAGFATAWALPLYGWSAVFLVAGLLTLALVPLCLALVREPPELGEHPPYSLSVAIAGRRLKSSLLLWLCTICGFMALYFIASWITKLAIQAGLPQRQAIIASAIYSAGAFFGTVLTSFIAARLDIRAVVSATLVLAAATFLIFGGVKMTVGWTLVVCFLIGVTLQGGVNGVYPLVAGAYPARARATGLGWAMGVGRIGAVIGPMIGGWALNRGLPLAATFAIFCIPLLVTATAAIGVDPAAARTAQ
jgi:MFS family permease